MAARMGTDWWQTKSYDVRLRLPIGETMFVTTWMSRIAAISDDPNDSGRCFVHLGGTLEFRATMSRADLVSHIDKALKGADGE